MKLGGDGELIDEVANTRMYPEHIKQPKLCRFVVMGAWSGFQKG